MTPTQNTVTVETCTEDAETGEITCVESTEPAGRTEIIEFPPPGEEDKSGAVPRACSFFAGQYICIEELEMTGLDSTLYVGAESSFTVTGEFLTPGAPPNENTYHLRVSISPASSGLYFERNPVNGSCSGTIKSVPVENAQGDGFHYSHDFTLYACDSPGGTVKWELVKNGSVLRSRSMTVEVPNRPPDIDGETDPEYRENDRIRVATYTISDEDGDRVRLSLLGPDSGDFFLDAINEYGILSFRNVPNYEEPADSNRDNVYNVTIRATDDGSPSMSTDFDVTIEVVDVNEPPEVAAQIGNLTVDLDDASPGISLLDKFRDPDFGDILTYDASSSDVFILVADVSGSELTFTPYWSGAVTVTVTAYDSGGLTAEQSFSVTVPNTDPPVIDGPTDIPEYPENQNNIDYPVGFYNVSDPHGDNVRLSLRGPDSGDFLLYDYEDYDEETVLIFRSPPDYENPADSNRDNIYNVTIRATDDGSPRLSTDLEVTIEVVDVNEPPEVAVRIGNQTVDLDDVSPGISLMDKFRDPDFGDILTYDASSSDDFIVAADVSGSELTFTPYWSGTVTVTVTAYDSGHLTAEQSFSVTVPNTDPPVIDGPTDIPEYPENQNNIDFPVGFYIVSDPHGDNVTLSLRGTDSGDFLLYDYDEYDEEAVLIFRSPPDYERPADSNRDNVYNVTIRATDDGSPRLSTDLEVTIEVGGENEHPEVGAQIGDQEFDQGGSFRTINLVGKFRDEDEGDENAFTYDAYSSDFNVVDAIVSDDNRMLTITPFEPGTATVTVTVYDRAGLSADQTFIVTVQKVNLHDPAITGLTDVSYPENEEYFVASYTASDDDGDNVTLSLRGTDSGDFSLDDGILTFGNPPNYEGPLDSGRNNIYNVTIRATDDGSPTRTTDLAVTITVLDVSEAPEVDAQIGNQEFDQGGSFRTINLVGKFRDEDEGDENAFTYDAYSSDFNVVDATVSDDNRTLTITPFEPGSATVTVTAYDRAGLAADQTFSVTVQKVNLHDPVIGGVTDVDYPENEEYFVASYTASDDDGDNVTLSLRGTDSGDFSLDDGVLTFRNPPNFESPDDSGRNNVYNVTIRATDDGSPTRTTDLAVTVTVLDVSEAPEIAVQIGDQELDQGGSFRTISLVGKFRDDDGDTLTYDAYSSDFNVVDVSVSDDNRTLTITPAGSGIATVSVTAYDGSGLSASQSFEVAVGNKPPTISGPSSRTFLENGTGTVATYTASDPDVGDIVTLSLAGIDSGEFGLGGGVLTFGSSPDYERPTDANGDNAYHVTIVATDDGSPVRTRELDVVITVGNVNEPPQVATRIGSLALNNVVGSSESIDLSDKFSDEDIGDVLTYQVEADPANVVSVSESGGTLMVTRVGPGTATVTVTARDRGGLSASQSFGVTAGNRPPVIEGPETPAYPENSPATEVVATYTADDPDAGDTVSWSLDGTDSGRFSINSAGELTFRSSPDYEAPADFGSNNVYSVTVRVADDGSPQRIATLPVTITVTNQDDSGVVNLSTNSPPKVGDSITATLADQDGGVRNLSWQWQRSSRDTSWSDIAGATGSQYTPVSDDIARRLRATASYGDAHGSGKSATSDATSIVGVTFPAIVRPPTISVGASDQTNVVTAFLLPGDANFSYELAVLYSEDGTFSGTPSEVAAYVFPSMPTHAFSGLKMAGWYKTALRACVDTTRTVCGPFTLSSGSLRKLEAPVVSISPLPLRRARLAWDSVTGANDYLIERSSATPSTVHETSTFHEFDLNGVMSQPGDVTFTVTAIDTTRQHLQSEPSPIVNLIDNPIVSLDGNSKSITTGPAAQRGQAIVRWPIVSGATEYTIRYRLLTGDHSQLNWRPSSPYPFRPQDGPPWQEIVRTPADLMTDPENSRLYKYPIEHLRLNGIYAVHVNYSKGSSEFFSAREAYVWPAKGFPGEPAQSEGEPDYPVRVATFPFFGHWPNGTYSYSICDESFPQVRSAQWQTLIESAVGQWDSATDFVRTQRMANCVVDNTSISQMESLRNDVNEIFMFRKEFIEGLSKYRNLPEEFESCLSSDACNIRELDDERWTEVPSASTRLEDGDVDVIINREVDDRVRGLMLSDYTLQVPGSVRFNSCAGGSSEYVVYALMVHEVGHALGLAGGKDHTYGISGSSNPRYAGHHPGLEPEVTVMAYAAAKPNADVYQCSPHPLDILAIHALYQGVGR